MALLAALTGDEQRIIFSQLCNVLDPGVAVAFGSTNSELRGLTQALLQQLRAEYEVAAALCRNLRIAATWNNNLLSCKKLREARQIIQVAKRLSGNDLATLGTLGSVLPALEKLHLNLGGTTAGNDDVVRLAAGLGAGALPAVTYLAFQVMPHVGDAGASALAAALGRGAMPRLKELQLIGTAISDVGLVALAPALRRLPALETLVLVNNPIGDEGIAALVAPPLPPAGALSPPTEGLKKLKVLNLAYTQVSDAGCATLAAALDSGALPALDVLGLFGIPASAAAVAAVHAGLRHTGSIESRA